MANGEIGKSLVDLVDVSQYVDAEENHYAYQVEEKLQVIGLHLNTLDTLLGNSVDETFFINEAKLDVEKLTSEDSENVYHKLVDCGILCHHKVRIFKMLNNATNLKNFKPFFPCSFNHLKEESLDELQESFSSLMKEVSNVGHLRRMVFDQVTVFC